MINATEAKENALFFHNLKKDMEETSKEISNRSLMGDRARTRFMSMDHYNDEYMRALKACYESHGYQVNMSKDFRPGFYQFNITW